MRSLIPCLLALIVVGCSPSKGPLSFQVPAGWKTERKTTGTLQFYSVTAGNATQGLLMISKWSPPTKPEEIPVMVQKFADAFLEGAKQSSEFSLATREYRVEQFAGSQCQGSYVVFRISDAGPNAVQTMFMMNVDGSIWHGQFTGPSNNWVQAIEVLKSVKKDG